MKNLECQKELFSLRENEYYFNCAYKAPLLKSAEAAAIKALIRERNPMDITAETCFEEMPVVKEYFAELINANASQIAIVPSASYGFTSALNNINGKPDGNAITVEDEFPSGYFALKRWCYERNNKMIVIAPDQNNQVGKSWNENVLDSINDQTSIVLMSSVHYMNGIKFDLEKIGNKCRQVGAQFIVDGTQSVGAMEMDIDKYKIDVLVCASYKWLLGPYSMALTYFSEFYDHGVPIEEAWLNRKNSNKFSQLSDYEEEYRPNAGRYNVGETSNYILMPLLKEALKQIVAWNPKNIQKYCSELIVPLIIYLKSLGIQFEEEAFSCSHVFALKLPPEINAEKLNKNLRKNKVHLSVRGEYLRISVNVFNDKEDIEKLILVISQTLK